MRRIVVATLLAVLAAAPTGAFGSEHANCRNRLPERNDRWQSLPAPSFGSGPTAIAGWVTSPDVHRQYATNGASVMASGDSGCTWTEIFAVTPSSVDPRMSPRVAQVGVVPAAGPTTVFVAVETRPLGPGLVSTGVEIHLSRDGGTEWVRADGGLPAGASVVKVEFGSDGTRGYALLRHEGLPSLGDEETSGSVLYTTSDAGASWIPAAGAAGADLEGFITGAEASTVWAWNGSGLLHSFDAGSTFTQVAGVRGTVSAVAMPSAARGRPAATPVVFTGNSMWQSRSGRWTRRQLPGAVDAAAYNGADTVVASSRSAMWLIEGDRPVRPIKPIGDEYVRGLVLPTTSPRDVWGYTTSRLFHGDFADQLGVRIPPPPVALLPEVPPVTLTPGRDRLPSHPELRPGALDVALRSGTRKTVRYTLDLPPTPTPVDVFFLIDTTPSFQQLIVDLRNQLATIVNELTARGVDAQFGVGAFREYPISAEALPGAPDNYAYRLVRRVGPVDDSLEAALNGLRTGGGTGDGRTSALAASYQAVTGAGQSVAPTAVHDGYVIPPGLDAKFRPDALRVVMLVTDTEPRKPSAGYPGPSPSEVATAMKLRGVHQVGLVVGAPPQGTPGPRETMEEIALQTGTVAPPGGVDCDSDGMVDIEATRPIVCDLYGGLASAIVQMLDGVRSPAEVHFALTGDKRLARPVSAQVYPIDAKSYNRVQFDVRFSCPPELGAHSSPVVLAARVNASHVARATARVLCKPRPVVSIPPAISLVVPRIAVAIIPPPPPPPAVNQIPNPNPNPNVNTNPQANPNPQAGAATQEKQEPQLAFANETLNNPDSDGALAMSGLPAGQPYGELSWGIALAMSAAFAAARERTRRNASPARAVVSRPTE